MDIIGFIPTPASPTGKPSGRQATGAEQEASQDFGMLLAKRQAKGDGTQDPSLSQLSSASQEAPLLRLKNALSALSPEQQNALSDRLQQDPAALKDLTAPQQEALASLLEGESLGDDAAQDLKAALSALGSSPLAANATPAKAAEGPTAWISDVDLSDVDLNDVESTTPSDTSQAPEVQDGPLGLSMIAERMNLIDQAGSSAIAAGQSDKLAQAGNAVAAGDARRDQAPLHAEWLNRNAAAQPAKDHTGGNHQVAAGTVFTDSAASTFLTEAGDTRNAAVSTPSTSTDSLPFSGSDRLSGLAGTAAGATPSSLSASVQTQAQAQVSSGALTAPVASQQWQQQLGQQLLGMTQRGEQQMELKLHPAELGPLSVSLKVAEHGAQAQFLSAHSQVRSALEQAIPQLREALAQQGITLGDTSVGQQQSGQSQEQALAGRQPQPLGGMGDADEAGLDVGSALTSRAPLENTALDGRVDLYA